MKSMTGFGKTTVINKDYELDIEIKSINHRFLDIQIRMPREGNTHELAIRQVIKETIQRGRVEVYINLKHKESQSKEVIVHWELVHPLLENLKKEMSARYPESSFDPQQHLQHLLKHSEYVEIMETSNEDTSFGPFLLETIKKTVDKLDNSRQQEGTKIQQILVDYLAQFKMFVQELAAFIHVYEQDYREKFEAKLKDWLGSQVDEARLLTELAILLEKGDIHEEIDRLMIHIEKLTDVFYQSKPIGRELDFLLQEMNREVNTIGSKSTSIESKNLVVKMKTTLEKIREQIQNIE